MQDRIRPSALPKLAQCRCYNDQPGEASEAAARGTLLDAVIRKAVANGGNIAKAAGAVKATLTDKDKAAVEWAVTQVRELAKGSPIITAAEKLMADPGIPGIVPGTMDTLIPAEQILVDYKTGMLRGYDEQMAAYALGCMQTYFADRWLTVLLFVDEQKAVYRTFAEAEARALLAGIVNAPEQPSVCEYCSWCAAYESCPLRLQMAEQAQQETDGLKALTPKQVAEIAENPASNSLVEQVTADPELAAQWIERANVVASYANAIKAIMKNKVMETETRQLGRWKLGKPSVSKVVPFDVVGHYIGEFGFGNVLEKYGSLSVKSFEELWQHTFPGKPYPVEKYVDGVTRAGSLTLAKPHKK